jgi:hypothetical protein
VPFDRFSINAK